MFDFAEPIVPMPDEVTNNSVYHKIVEIFGDDYHDTHEDNRHNKKFTFPPMVDNAFGHSNTRVKGKVELELATLWYATPNGIISYVVTDDDFVYSFSPTHVEITHKDPDWSSSFGTNSTIKMRIEIFSKLFKLYDRTRHPMVYAVFIPNYWNHTTITADYRMMINEMITQQVFDCHLGHYMREKIDQGHDVVLVDTQGDFIPSYIK